MPPARTLTPPYPPSPTLPTLDMRLDEGGEGGPDARAGAAQTAQAMPKGAGPSGPSDQVMSAIPPPRSPSQLKGGAGVASRLRVGERRAWRRGLTGPAQRAPLGCGSPVWPWATTSRPGSHARGPYTTAPTTTPGQPAQRHGTPLPCTASGGATAVRCA